MKLVFYFSYFYFEPKSGNRRDWEKNKTHLIPCVRVQRESRETSVTYEALHTHHHRPRVSVRAGSTSQPNRLAGFRSSYCSRYLYDHSNIFDFNHLKTLCVVQIYYNDVFMYYAQTPVSISTP